MKEPVTISMSAYDIKVDYEIGHSDTTIDEMIRGVVTCLFGLGFMKETIIHGFKEYIEEYSNDD